MSPANVCLLKSVTLKQINDFFSPSFVQICDLLANKKDTIRKEYWLFLGRSLKNKYGGADVNGEEPESAPLSET